MEFRSFPPPDSDAVSAMYTRKQIKEGFLVTNYKRRFFEDYPEKTKIFYPGKPAERKRRKLACASPANQDTPCREARWDALPGLCYFLSHRTTLQELSLYISGLKKKDGFDKYLDEDSEHFALLQQMDFSSLVHLKTLTLSYSAKCSPGSRVRMPWSRSILGLPRLEALHMGLDEVGQVCHLPLWLAELRAFASLTFFSHLDDHLQGLPYSDVLANLRELVIRRDCDSFHPGSLATIARLQAMTSLQVMTSAGRQEFYPGLATASGLLLPGAKRLHLAVQELPAVRSPLPLLGDLWLRVSEQTCVQPNLFAFTPALQVLHLELVSAASWPDFRHLPAQLKFLTLRLSVKAEAGDSARVVNIGHLAALEKLHLTCGVLPALVGLSSLSRPRPCISDGSSSSSSSLVAVTVECNCHADNRTPFIQGPGFLQRFCSRFFQRYRQYAGDAHPCRFLPLAVARELFPDARPLLSADPEGVEAISEPHLQQQQQQEEEEEKQQEQEQEQEEQEGTPQHACAPPLALAGPTTRSRARRHLAARLQSGRAKRGREDETEHVPAHKRARDCPGGVSGRPSRFPEEGFWQRQPPLGVQLELGGGAGGATVGLRLGGAGGAPGSGDGAPRGMHWHTFGVAAPEGRARGGGGQAVAAAGAAAAGA
eukprot:jgi/Mesen1/8102/ME000435S07277